MQADPGACSGSWEHSGSGHRRRPTLEGSVLLRSDQEASRGMSEGFFRAALRSPGSGQ